MDLSTVHAAAHYTRLLAGTGIFDTITEKSGSATGALQAVGTTASIGFVIYQGIQSRGAMARILISGVVAGAFLWIIWNVDILKQHTGTEFTGAGPAPVTVAAPRPPAGLLQPPGAWRGELSSRGPDTA